jgi:hypothetical protein
VSIFQNQQPLSDTRRKWTLSAKASAKEFQLGFAKASAITGNRVACQ